MLKAFAEPKYCSFIVLLPVAFFFVSCGLFFIHKIENKYVNLSFLLLLGGQKAKNFSSDVLIRSEVEE